jgi:hypothetical protein
MDLNASHAKLNTRLLEKALNAFNIKYIIPKFLPRLPNLSRLPNLPNGMHLGSLFHRGETFLFVSSGLNLFGFYLTGMESIFCGYSIGVKPVFSFVSPGHTVTSGADLPGAVQNI